MIEAKHHPLVSWFFRLFAARSIHKHFHEVVTDGHVDCSNHAVLMFSNHISWWDGFWALYLNTKIFGKRFHFMMDEKELKKRWLFNYTGGYSITGNKTMFESLAYTGELLENPENLVVIYPQGKLYSSHVREVQFKRGVERINIPDKTKVVFLVQITDYYQFKKPTLYFYYTGADEQTVKNRQFGQAYQQFYQECIKKHSSIVV
jgi:1-acyl-sn-glycerol-3-phosphate acyltransferase